MRTTDDDQRLNDSAPHKIPGALTPPIPWDGQPAPVTPPDENDAEVQAKPPKGSTSGFSSFES